MVSSFLVLESSFLISDYFQLITLKLYVTACTAKVLIASIRFAAFSPIFNIKLILLYSIVFHDFMLSEINRTIVEHINF